MKRNIFLLLFSLIATVSWGQSNLNDLLAAGLSDAERFTTDYLSPASEGIIYGISGSWYNSADAKPLGGFEISIVGNLTGFKNKQDKKEFTLDINDYENLRFVDQSTSKQVSTALGDIEGVQVVVTDGTIFSDIIELPSGLASEDLNFLPSGYVQASVGLIKGTEVKARFLPKINAEDASISLYGFGVQHDFTKHLPADKVLPVAISAVIGYTHLSGEYDFTDTNVVDGENQRIDMDVNTWNFQAVVSTRLPVINFYGGVGYLTGKSETAILGTYVVRSGPFQTTYEDPFTINTDASGVTANIGTKLKLGFFRIHADYTIAEFNNLSVGINFGFR